MTLGTRGLRELAPAGGDAFRALPYHGYGLERWGADGRRPPRFVRSPAWFPPWIERAVMSPTMRPSPHALGLSAIDGDHVWTVVRIGTEPWGRGLRAVRAESGRELHVADDLALAYDSIIELGDVRQGRVVVRAVAARARELRRRGARRRLPTGRGGAYAHRRLARGARVAVTGRCSGWRRWLPVRAPTTSLSPPAPLRSGRASSRARHGRRAAPVAPLPRPPRSCGQTAPPPVRSRAGSNCVGLDGACDLARRAARQ
jgi:hypothetical protein